jgi:hypothetical protein
MNILLVPTRNRKKNVLKKNLARVFQKQNAHPQDRKCLLSAKELLCMVMSPPNTTLGNFGQVFAVALND